MKRRIERLCLAAKSLMMIGILSAVVPAGSAINFDYDNKSDLGVYRGGVWWGLSTESNTSFAIQWGLAADSVVPADYDGDGLTDLTVFRPETGTWWVRRSRDGAPFVVSWGVAGDKTVPADYDGDGMTDIAVWRPETGVWYILTSSSGYNPQYFNWGKFGDDPVPADYDGDGRADIAVYRVTEGRWYIVRSSTGAFEFVDFSAGSCCSKTAFPADYTGDGLADAAHYRADGIWLIRQSEDGTVVSREFGLFADPPVTPVADDYDGDGKTDLGLFNRGNWFTFQSMSASQINYGFGLAGDRPLQGAAFQNR